MKVAAVNMVNAVNGLDDNAVKVVVADPNIICFRNYFGKYSLGYLAWSKLTYNWTTLLVKVGWLCSLPSVQSGSSPECAVCRSM